MSSKLESFEDLEALAGVEEEEDTPKKKQPQKEEPEAEPAQEDEPVEEPQTEPVKKEVTEDSSEPQVPVYVPNYDLEVTGKKVEFPEWAKQAIKDAETEKEMKDILSKVHGFEYIKHQKEKYKTEHEAISKKYQEISNNYKESEEVIQHIASAVDLIEKNNVLEGLTLLTDGRPDLLEKIYQGIVKYHQADEVTKAQMVNQYTNNIHRIANEKQQKGAEAGVNEYKTKYEQAIINNTFSQVQYEVAKDPEMEFIETEIQRRTGSKDFMINYIANLGKTMYPDITQANIPHLVSEAKKLVKQYFGIANQPAPGNANPVSQNPVGNANPQTMKPTKTVIVQKQDAPTMPSMSANPGGAINKGKMSSLKDLQAMAGIEED